MKGLFGMVALALVVVVAGEESASANNYCYQDVSINCRAGAEESPSSASKCNAVYGAADSLMGQFSNYVNTHIMRNFQYLLMSTHFGSYKANRPGFEKLFRVLSDQSWDHAQDLIKHMTKRGGKMNFNINEDDNLAKKSTIKKEVYELRELEGLARALDIQKSLAQEAFTLHHQAKHDPELSQYLEEKFIEGHADTIRNLAGHTSDLMNLSKAPDASLSVYLFDEYLFKKLSA